MTEPDTEKSQDTAKQNLKQRNLAVAGAVVLFVVLMYALTVVKYQDLLAVDKL